MENLNELKKELQELQLQYDKLAKEIDEIVSTGVLNKEAKEKIKKFLELTELKKNLINKIK